MSPFKDVEKQKAYMREYARKKRVLGFMFDLSPKMTKIQLAELERLRSQVKNKELTVNEARDIWDMKFGKK
jgi:Zn-dependent oligopeptidase